MSYSGRASAGCSAGQLPTQMLYQGLPPPAALATGVVALWAPRACILDGGRSEELANFTVKGWLRVGTQHCRPSQAVLIASVA